MIKKWLSYVRYPFAGIAGLLATGFYSFAVMFVSVFHRRKWEQIVIRLWGLTLLGLFNVKPLVYGLENLPEEGVLFVFNHSSHFDILLVHAVTPKICRFGAKIELFRIPIFAQAMRAAGALPIARGNRAEVFKVYEEAEKRFTNGESFILAPEGTRQTEPQIGPFKTGPFIFAINAKVAIVPIVIEGAIDIMKKGSLLVNWGVWRKTVQIQYLPPVRPKEWNLDYVHELQQSVREQMMIGFQKLRETRNQLEPDS